ncbi:MAG: radical SAM protein [Patescibacteria group bacterium]|nr:radical SAM protein [Patescibacteria group bacterium]
MLKIAVATLGCKVNHYESAGIIEKLKADGNPVVPFTTPADVYIVNTCTVTAKTDFQSRQLVRRAYRTNPSARIIVTGCYAQTAPQELAVLPGVKVVAGTEIKEMLPGIIQNVLSGEQRVDVSDIGLKKRFSGLPVTKFPGQTRAYLKIQDGCDAFCSYCIIPYARGRSRSLPPEDVIRQIQGLTEAGHREIILTGIHIGAYGHDLTSPTTLLNLLRQTEYHTGLERLRISSINPAEISGVCGRLLCCLAYEIDTYREARRRLPKVGAVVMTPEGKGRVRKVHALREALTVKLEDDKLHDFSIDDIEGFQRSAQSGSGCGGCEK